MVAKISRASLIMPDWDGRKGPAAKPSQEGTCLLSPRHSCLSCFPLFRALGQPQPPRVGCGLLAVMDDRELRQRFRQFLDARGRDLGAEKN
jgi:hypothetical protein